MYYTYILKCSNLNKNKHIFYVGSTKDLRRRITMHKSKSTRTTKSFNNIELVYYEACLNKADAMKRENQLKTGFGRGYIKKRIENYLKNLKQM